MTHNPYLIDVIPYMQINRYMDIQTHRQPDREGRRERNLTNKRINDNLFFSLFPSFSSHSFRPLDQSAPP